MGKQSTKQWQSFSLMKRYELVNNLINNPELYTIYSKNFNLYPYKLKYFVDSYLIYGINGLKDIPRNRYTKDDIFYVLHYMEVKKLSLHNTGVYFRISPSSIRIWIRRYLSTGMYKEYKLTHKINIKSMPVKKSQINKINSNVKSEKELLEELEYLRAENAYLKKLRALVQERIEQEEKKK